MHPLIVASLVVSVLSTCVSVWSFILAHKIVKRYRERIESLER